MMKAGERRTLFRCLGGMLVLGGASVVVALFREGGQPSLAWVFVLAPVAAALIGGVQMVRGFPAAYRLAIAGLVPQLVSLIGAGLQFRIVMGAILGPGVAGMNQKVRVGMFFETGTQLLLSFDPTVPVWAVQVNLIPLTMVIVMLWFRPRPSLPEPPST